jgi:aldehyde:ferredoxin oxidoreductase
MPGVVFDWGAKCAIDNLPAIWKCKELCQQFGMDYASAAGCVAFVMELFQRGLLTERDTDGLQLNWGNEDAAMQMLHRIAFREGFGDILAEGSLRAAKKVGKGAERYVMAIKGVEMMSHEPRSGQRGWVFGEITNPRGGDNVKNTHFYADRYNPNWWVDKFDMFDEVKAKIYAVPPEKIADTWEGKPLMCKWFEDLYSLVNGLGLCFFPVGFRLAWGPTYLSRLFSACTGWETTPQDIMKFGEKIFTLLKVYAVRQGLTRKDDTWPDRFYEEPLPEGPAKGTVLSRDEIERLLDEYYELRGWDKGLGIPTREKLVEVGLHDIANAFG